jgi:hypothetical protein
MENLEEIKKVNDAYALMEDTIERLELSPVSAIYVLTRLLHEQNMIIDDLEQELLDDEENLNKD